MGIGHRISYRTLTPDHASILWEMLRYAAHEPSVEAVRKNPDLARYVAQWGRPGDLGLVAYTQHPVGAVWLRLWADKDRGYGYIDGETPELAIAVAPPYQGQGIGTHLLTQVLSLAADQFDAVSLSVRADSPAFKLYQRIGFQPVPGQRQLNRVGGTSLTMIYRLDR